MREENGFRSATKIWWQYTQDWSSQLWFVGTLIVMMVSWVAILVIIETFNMIGPTVRLLAMASLGTAFILTLLERHPVIAIGYLWAWLHIVVGMYLLFSGQIYLLFDATNIISLTIEITKLAIGLGSIGGVIGLLFRDILLKPITS